MGSPQEHHDARFQLTEEFISVYRMHPLLRDDWNIFSAGTGELLHQDEFVNLQGASTRKWMDNFEMGDLIYSMGVEHPGAITLHNYPRALQRFTRIDGELMDLATLDILRDRERGVPRYNDFREEIRMPRVRSFDELTPNKQWAEEIRRVYNNDIDKVDLQVGMYAEPLPPGFGFSDTAFRVFILMASRRLKSDRFFTTDFRPEVYTQTGIDWVTHTKMKDVLLRHHPELEPALEGMPNAFLPWHKVSADGKGNGKLEHRAEGCEEGAGGDQRMSATETPTRDHSAPGESMASSRLPSASLSESLSVLGVGVVPALVRGLFAPRRGAMKLLTRLDTDRRAVSVLSGLRRRHGGEGVRLLGGRIAVLWGTEAIGEVLGQSAKTYASDSGAKGKGMSHFQPDALTLSRGEEWRDRRDFTEAVLASRRAPTPVGRSVPERGGRGSGRAGKPVTPVVAGLGEDVRPHHPPGHLR